jgi:hypothetical protein
MLRPMARHQQVERLRDAANGGEFELGAAIAEIADDAIEPGSPIVENDGRNDHRVAARLDTLFSPSKHWSPVSDDDAVIIAEALCEAANVPPRIRTDGESRD